MTRTLLGATLAFGLLVCSGQPSALADGALIQTTAPLADRSEESVKAAVTAAIGKAMRGASAMGFAWVELRDAQLSGNEVVVQILATDEDPDQLDEIAPGAEPDASGDAGILAEEPAPGLPAARVSRPHI
jgi:hypothetical protein